MCWSWSGSGTGTCAWCKFVIEIKTEAEVEIGISMYEYRNIEPSLPLNPWDVLLFIKLSHPFQFHSVISPLLTDSHWVDKPEDTLYLIVLKYRNTTYILGSLSLETDKWSPNLFLLGLAHSILSHGMYVAGGVGTPGYYDDWLGAKRKKLTKNLLPPFSFSFFPSAS